MTFEIGSKYLETKARLRQQILDGTAKVLEKEIDLIAQHGANCFFCRKHINGMVIQLIEEHENGYFLHPVDVFCFRQAQINFYLNDIPFSVN